MPSRSARLSQKHRSNTYLNSLSSLLLTVNEELEGPGDLLAIHVRGAGVVASILPLNIIKHKVDTLVIAGFLNMNPGRGRGSVGSGVGGK